MRGEDELFTPQLRDRLTAASELLEERNSLLHSRWTHDDSGSPVQVRGKKTSSRVLLQVSEEDMDDIARDMGEMVSGLELDWFGIVIRLGRAEPIPGREGFVYMPARWSVEGDIQPARSTQKSDLDRYVEGKISIDEYTQQIAAKKIGKT
ncbi:MAG: hypothetical protein ABI130_00640 [Leifsonia sp.]